MSDLRIRIWGLVVFLFTATAVLAQTNTKISFEPPTPANNADTQKPVIDKNKILVKTSMEFINKTQPEPTHAIKEKNKKENPSTKDKKFRIWHNDGNVILIPSDSSQLVNIAGYAKNDSGNDQDPRSSSNKIFIGGKIK